MNKVTSSVCGCALNKLIISVSLSINLCLMSKISCFPQATKVRKTKNGWYYYYAVVFFYWLILAYTCRDYCVARTLSEKKSSAYINCLLSTHTQLIFITDCWNFSHDILCTYIHFLLLLLRQTNIVASDCAYCCCFCSCSFCIRLYLSNINVSQFLTLVFFNKLDFNFEKLFRIWIIFTTKYKKF